MSELFSFGAWVRRQRRALDLTQEALALRLGCAVVTIRRIEADERRPSKQLAARLADCLELGPEERAPFLQAARGELPVDQLGVPASPSPGKVGGTPAQAVPDTGEQSFPSGIVTFLFTDIEGSTRRWEAYPAAMQMALARHDTILRQAIAAHAGVIFKTLGDGVCAAFAHALAALDAALAAQRAILAADWGAIGGLRVRMALHTAMVMPQAGEYRGPALNRAAQLLAAGHGGQVLLSLTTAELVRELLPPDIALRDLGELQLQDVARPEHLFQLVAPELPASFPPLRTLPQDQTNLPVPLTALIGREREVADVKQLLVRTRLLTLTGAGGSGKTRLALAVAADLRAEFSDGIFFVNLAPIDDSNLVLPTVAKTLDIREQDGRPLAKALRAHLRDRQTLLVLDNFEQVIPATVQVVDWLAACPRLRVLVTSREVLRVHGEQEYSVRPLAVPSKRRTADGGHEGQSALDIAQYPAVALFVERARAVRPDFALADENTHLVAEICRRLDGLPLAIELAAARTNLLSVQQMAARLDAVFQLLTRRERAALPRHQTLRATVDWSYALLSESERMLLRRLSVFAGGFTLEAAEGICVGQGVDGEDLLDILSGLADKSLVMVQHIDGETRYHLLETIRQYAAEKLQAAGEADIRARHAAFFGDLAGAAERWLMTVEREPWLRELEAEHDNTRAALRWLLTNQPERSLQVASALLWFWWFRGYWSEGRSWIEQALAQTGGASSIGDRAKGLFAAGMLAWFQNDFAGACPHLEESEALYRTLGEERGLAQALIYGGGALYGQGDFPHARAKLEEALAIGLRLQDQWLIALSRLGLGDVMTAQGEPRLGWAMLEESLQFWRQIGDERLMAYALMYLGQAQFALGNYPAAQLQLAEGLAIHRRVGQTSGVAIALLGLADVAASEGAYERAATYCRDALMEFYALDARQGVAESLERIAGLAVVEGQLLPAARLLGAADTLRKAIGAPVTPLRRIEHEQAVSGVRSGLGEAAFSAAWAEGQAMSLAQLRSYALACLSPATPDSGEAQ